ncbi:MAG: glycoside hydrolase family 88 protein, partial [Clostridia bacterium]|nr:glycoside hydrolase family 88 protein [Clostridia bacterium]
MHVGTNKDVYKETALVQEKLLDKAFANMQDWHHDVGFMWHILSGVNYRLNNDQDSKNRNLIAAMSLSSRYNVTGNFIRCWNGDGTEDVSGWTIIDCMMNIPILYWASKEIGDDRFKKIAMKHADMSLRDHVREDGSVNHIVVHNTEKEEVICTKGGQGYAVGSSWSRGTAWGLYGFTLSYIYTKEERYLRTAEKIADYFIDSVEKFDWLPRLDFRQPEDPMYYDSTAGVIACCGIIELSKFMDKGKKDKYLQSAINILKAMSGKWCNWEENEDSILQMGSEMYTSGIHKPIIYGDYFFVEAILKLKGIEFLPW